MVRSSSPTDNVVTTLAPHRSASDDARDLPALATLRLETWSTRHSVLTAWLTFSTSMNR
jgi:hypothetical protein